MAWRRIRKGDDLAQTIRRHPPVSREEVGPFTVLLYNERGSFNTLRIVAANGVLIEARAACRGGEHVFFESPSQREAFHQAHAEYASQQVLEVKAYQIHRAMRAGQDVFVSKRIDRRYVIDANDPQYDQEMMRQFVQIYGRDYANQMMAVKHKKLALTVEVSKVLSGDLEPGTELRFSGDHCDDADLAEPETVFLHVADARTIDSDSQGGELYLTVPRKALDWYQSLTGGQIKDFEARCLVREAKPQD